VQVAGTCLKGIVLGPVESQGSKKPRIIRSDQKLAIIKVAGTENRVLPDGSDYLPPTNTNQHLASRSVVADPQWRAVQVWHKTEYPDDSQRVFDDKPLSRNLSKIRFRETWAATSCGWGMANHRAAPFPSQHIWFITLPIGFGLRSAPIRICSHPAWPGTSSVGRDLDPVVADSLSIYRLFYLIIKRKVVHQ
jgi:hypothetical protein